MSGQTVDLGFLFSSTWEQYKSRALPIMAVMVISLSLVVIVMFFFSLAGAFIGKTLFSGPQYSLLAGIITAVGAILIAFPILCILAMWSQTSVLAVAVDDSLGIYEGLRAGRKYLWPMSWISLLYIGILTSGLFFAIIPGIIFLIWFSFALFIMIEEGKRGMDTLLASREYVRGHWWDTFFKFVVIWIISAFVSVVPYVNWLLSLLFTPFMVLFLVNVYRNLKELKGGEVKLTGEEGNGFWDIMAYVGISLPIIGLIVALVMIGTNFKTFLEYAPLVHPTSRISTKKILTKPPPTQKVEEESKVKKTGPVMVDSQKTSGEGNKVEPATEEPKNFVSWKDPAGDVVQLGISRWLDIREVSALGEDGILKLTVKLNNPLSAFVNEDRQNQSFGRLASFYIDTDLNSETGGDIMKGSGHTGYDFRVDVMLESLPDKPDTAITHVSVFRINGQKVSSLGGLSEEQIEMGENAIAVHVPYKSLGLERGKKIRLAYIELSQGIYEGISEDKTIVIQ